MNPKREVRSNLQIEASTHMYLGRAQATVLDATLRSLAISEAWNRHEIADLKDNIAQASKMINNQPAYREVGIEQIRFFNHQRRNLRVQQRELNLIMSSLKKARNQLQRSFSAAQDDIQGFVKPVDPNLRIVEEYLA